MNARGAFLEVASDTFGALAVMVTAAIIAITGFTLADPIASLAVGVLILPRDLAAAAGRGGRAAGGQPAGHRPDRGPRST